ncbi:acetyltransferase [Pseudidiomarina sediminum]|uniref:LpxL/LpxP family acyltransferase n=1 Tax=Pseudidiomarina sediminum TaxID=431675 RepID=UPI001C968F8F|nr:acetyltransferase [Pseudidiomarina sediminum]MBY6064342.1 acetyltransferase [Pseudidiomarina sediminum]
MSHWAKKEERGSYWGIVFILRAYKYGGHWLMRLVLAPVILYFFLTGGDARRASLSYLQRLHQFSGPASPFARAPNWRNSLRHFWQFGLASLAKTDAWIGRIQRTDVQNCGNTLFQDLEQRSEGGILIGSHLGNLEVARAIASSSYSKRMNVLVFTEHAQAFNRALQELNPSVAIDIIQVTSIDMALAIRLRERVDQGEFVVIVGDRVSVTDASQSVQHDFLGVPAPFAIGPWVLASVLECPVYLLFCLRRTEDAGFDLHLDLLTTQLKLPRRERQQAIQEVLSRYVAKLEMLCQRYPYQWFNFYSFWQQHDKDL